MKTTLQVYLCKALYFIAGILITAGDKAMNLADEHFDTLVPPPKETQGKLFD
jgi:hypothetical protein